MAKLESIRTTLGRLFGVGAVGGPNTAASRAISVQRDASNNVFITGDVHVASERSGQPVTPPSPLHQLPADIADFAGRGRQVETLVDLLSAPGGRAAISAIDGMGGLGKTTLAVHVGHHLKERYPDAQIVVDMAGTSATPLSAAQALARVIRVFEPVAQLPEDTAELRPIYLHVLHDKCALLILDNALDGNQVAPLLPPGSCGLIVTSRRQIAVSGLGRVDLDLLTPDEATGLLRSILGDNRASTAELSRIAELCELLPLALRVAGMFLAVSPHWSAAEYITALADERARLAHLQMDGNAELDVAASLALSVRELRREHPDFADRWHELAVFPAGFNADAAAAVWNQPAAVIRDALGLLLSRSMVLYDVAQQRWRLHDLMRDLAGAGAAPEVLGAPPDLTARLVAAAARHAVHYCTVLAAANDLYLKGGADMGPGLALFDRERRNIETGQIWAADRAEDDAGAARLCMLYPDVGVYILDLRHHPRQLIAWSQAAAAAARQVGDRRHEGAALGNLGLAYANLGETRRAIEFCEKHLAITREIGDRRGEGNALGNLGNAHANLGETRRAIEFFEKHLTITREIGDRRSEGHALGNLGNAYANLGETRRAIEFYERVLTIMREIGDRRHEGNTLGNLGIAYANLGEPRRAIEFYERALMIAREIGDRRHEANALGNLGNAYAALSETGRAIKFYEQVLTIMREIGDRRGEGYALGNIGNAYANLGEQRRAIEFDEQQLIITQEIGDRRGEGNALSNLGNAYGALGETRRAIGLLRDALGIFDAIESPNAAQVRASIAKLEQQEEA